MPFIFAGLGACTSVGEGGTHAKTVKVYMLSDGSCKVLSRKLGCGDAPRYMHDTLKLSDVSQFTIVVRGKPSYKMVSSFYEALGSAGFSGKIGIVDIADMKE